MPPDPPSPDSSVPGAFEHTTAPVSRHVVVCDVHGVPWRVLDVVPGHANGGDSGNTAPGVTWATPPAPGATGRVFVAAVDGRKVVRVLDRHRTDPWNDLSLPRLRGQLDDAHAPPPGWVARHARPYPVRSSLLYP